MSSPAAPAPEGQRDPAPGYLWAAYALKIADPFTAHGTAETADDAREEAEKAMTARPAETDFAVILAHDGNDKIGRRTGNDAYRWTHYHPTRHRPVNPSPPA
jgi:hypothetical protein